MSLKISSGSLDKVFVNLEAFGRSGGFATNKMKSKVLELLYHAQDNRDLQIYFTEGDADSHLVPSQQSSEIIYVLTHITQLGPVSEACPTATGSRRTS